MKFTVCLAALALPFSAAVAQPPATPNSAATPQPSPAPGGGVLRGPLTYVQFATLLASKPALADLIARSDALITAVDGPEGSGQTLGLDTACGVHLEFSVLHGSEAILYYLRISRNGAELHYSEAVKIASLFADRAALGHPIDVTEGERPLFHCQWFYNPSGWKKTRKNMLAIREKVRAAKIDPQQAFSVAIEEEMRARANAHH